MPPAFKPEHLLFSATGGATTLTENPALCAKYAQRRPTGPAPIIVIFWRLKMRPLKEKLNGTVGWARTTDIQLHKLAL